MTLLRPRRLAALLAGAAALLGADVASAYTVYVSNEKGNSISVIDSTTLEVKQTVKVGRRPRGITMSPDGKAVYVCASDDHAVQVIDPATLKILRKLKSGPDPELFALHPTGNPLYIANEDDNQVTVLDVEANKVIAQVPVGTEPEGMAVSPDGNTLVATSETTNMAHFIDTKTNKIIGNVLVDARPRFAEFTADGKRLWVSAEVGGTVSVIDPQTADHQEDRFQDSRRVQGIHPAGGHPHHQGRQARLRGPRPANRVAVVNAETFEVEKYLLVGQRVWQLAFTPDEKLLFTTNGNSNDVSVIDVPDLKVVKSIKVGGARGALWSRPNRWQSSMTASAWTRPAEWSPDKRFKAIVMAGLVPAIHADRPGATSEAQYGRLGVDAPELGCSRVPAHRSRSRQRRLRAQGRA